jgi:hypothetical protein
MAANGTGPGASVLAIGILALGLIPPATQSPAHPPSASHTADRSTFLVAFELRADRREEFVWPHPSFPRAKYASVLLVVDGMPRVRVGKTGQLQAMTAAHHLKINGRLLEPKDVVRCLPSGRETTCEELVVGLEAGRLRLSLVLPGDAEIDPHQQRAHIPLYERN